MENQTGESQGTEFQGSVEGTENVNQGAPEQTEIDSVIQAEVEKRLQSELDRQVTQAIKTREENLRKKITQELEIERLKKEDDTKKLLKYYEEQLNEIKTREAKAQLKLETERGLKELDLQDISDIYDYDFSSVDGRIEAAKILKAKMDLMLEKKLNDRIKTSQPVVKQSNTVDLSKRDINSMSLEELKELEKLNGTDKLGTIYSKYK